MPGWPESTFISVCQFGKRKYACSPTSTRELPFENDEYSAKSQTVFSDVMNGVCAWTFICNLTTFVRSDMTVGVDLALNIQNESGLRRPLILLGSLQGE